MLSSVKKKISERASLLFFLSPTLFFIFFFIAFPILFSGYLSFTEFNYAKDTFPNFIGIQGYTETILHDGFFATALWNQVKFAIPYFLISFFLSLGLAILLNELVRGAYVFQTIFYIPMIVPMSLVGITFAWFLAPDMGIFNQILRNIGLGNLATYWYGEPSTALYSLVVARSWKMIGFTLIVFFSGLQSIPSSIREAAKVDGANFWQEIRYVMIPNIKPYLFIGGVWVLINSLKVFVLPRVITEGGPGQSTLTLYLYSWKAAFQRLAFGKAARVAYLTALIILALSWVMNKMLGAEETEDVA